jgi:hypothetical protein
VHLQAFSKIADYAKEPRSLAGLRILSFNLQAAQQAKAGAKAQSATHSGGLLVVRCIFVMACN